MGFTTRLFSLILVIGIVTGTGCDIIQTELSSLAPSVEIVSPAGNDLIAGVVPIFVRAEAYLNSPDNRIEIVHIAIDGSPVGQAQRATYGAKPFFVYMWNTLTYPDGMHRIQVEALDTDGARGLSEIETLTVENGLNNGPLVSIVQPVAEQEVSGTTTVSVSTIPNEPAVAWVDLLIDGITVIRLSGPDYEYEWNTRLEVPGVHTLQAKSFGTDGLIRLSVVIPVAVTGG